MKYLWWTLTFVGILFGGDRLGGLFLNYLTENSQFRYSRMYQYQSNSDLVFLGNSRGLSFYQPYLEEKTGKQTFNLSYNGLPMDLGSALLMDYLDQNNPPEMILIDITMCDRENPALLGQFTTYQALSARIQSLVWQKNRKTAVGAEVSHLFRYNNEIFHRALFYSNKPDKNWLLDRKITKSLIEKVNRRTYTFDLLFEPSAVKELGLLVQYLKKEKIPFRLVVNPYFPAFREKMTDLDELIELVESETGAPVLDYSISIEDEAGFGDLQHLNVKGAKSYIDLLIKDKIL